MSQPIKTPIEPGIVARIAAGLRLAVTGQAPDWFGPMEPLAPVVPENQQSSVKGRQFDYPVGFNTRITPRQGEVVSFGQMRSLADGYDIMRLVIETRKDQLAKLKWNIRPKDEEAESDDRCKAIIEFLSLPDQEHTWDEWLRMLLEDLFVIDAPTLYIRQTLGGQLYAIEPVDGSTIKRVIDEMGRTPMPPDPAFQQVLKGVQAVDYTRDELIYKPRNVRTHKLYGFSPVEQVIMTVNIALRRQIHQLNYYTEGNVPEALASVPKEWNPDQIAQFQLYWDSLLEGDLAARRHLKFIPDGVKYQETKPQALKDDYDEWLARVICFAFSLEPTAFVKQQNRATADTARDAALSEGLAPIMVWVKSLIDSIIVKQFGAADLEFEWVDQKAENPMEEAQIAQIYLAQKVLTPDEVRSQLGLEPLTPEQREAAWPTPVMLGDPNEENADGSGGADPDPVPDDGNDDVGGKEAVAKSKKAVASIDRERPSIDASRKKLTKKVKNFLSSMSADVARQVVAAKESIGKTNADDIQRILDALNFDEWAVIVGDVAPIIEAMTRDGAGVAMAQIGIDSTDDKLVTLVNEHAVEWARDRAASWVGMKWVDDELIPNPNEVWQIDEATREMLRGTVTEAMDGGWSNDELAAAIGDAACFSDERAEMIARTETAFADVAGNMAAYKESGLVASKQWITGADCCEECWALDGLVVALDANFPGGGDAPPLHPNCRCDVVPVLGDQDTE